jgi:hypothetical protein
MGSDGVTQGSRDRALEAGFRGVLHGIESLVRTLAIEGPAVDASPVRSAEFTKLGPG